MERQCSLATYIYSIITSMFSLFKKKKKTCKAYTLSFHLSTYTSLLQAAAIPLSLLPSSPMATYSHPYNYKRNLTNLSFWCHPPPFLSSFITRLAPNHVLQHPNNYIWTENIFPQNLFYIKTNATLFVCKICSIIPKVSQKKKKINYKCILNKSLRILLHIF